MTGFGRGSENERFRRPRAVAVTRPASGRLVVLAAGAAIALVIALWIVASGAGF